MIRIGEQVIIKAGWGGSGGAQGQDFRRFIIDTPAIVTDVTTGSDIYVRPDDSPYKWRVRKHAVQEL
jgi:hypothetical protein